MLIEHMRKLQKRPCHADFRDRTVNDLTEVVLLKFIALVTGQQNIVAADTPFAMISRIAV